MSAGAEELGLVPPDLVRSVSDVAAESDFDRRDGRGAWGAIRGAGLLLARRARLMDLRTASRAACTASTGARWRISAALCREASRATTRSDGRPQDVEA